MSRPANQRQQQHDRRKKNGEPENDARIHSNAFSQSASQAGRAKYTQSSKKSPRNLTQVVVSQLPTIQKIYHSQRNNRFFNCENSMENMVKPRFQHWHDLR
jgi:hypothetical protein